MKRSLLVIFIFIQWCGLCYAQQYALYNTRTLFDAFENPSQKAFIPDSSKKYAFNFFVPNLSFSSEFKGNMPAQTTLKKILFKRIFDASNLINTSGMNNFYADQNTYLVMLRIFGNVYLNSEKGFAWQIKTDIRGTVSNETLAILHNSNLFTSGTPYEDVLNNSLNGISYHQFSFSYRENYSKRLGLGIKLSYLSGIGYSSLSMDKSEVLVDQLNNTYDVSLKGKYRTNILLNDPGDKIIQPGIKNPGLAIGISANYKLHRGWYLLGNLKDLGFIKWKKDPYTYRFDESLHFDKNTTNKQDNSFDNKISNDLLDAAETKSFITPINGKAELLITKNLRNYQPTLLLTKNLINRGGIIALTNALQHRAFNFSLTNAYNLDKYFMHGGQFMIKSPNTEFYLGSDHLFKSYYVAKGLKTENEHIGKGNTAASVYLGFSLKFGRVQQRWQNASIIPMDDKKVGFFKRVFLKIFKKKKKPGGQDERE